MASLTEEMLTLIRTGMHPFILKTMGSSPAAQAHSSTTYHPSMAAYLPDPSDARGILDFFGLDEPAIDRVLSAAGPSVISLPGKVRDASTGSWRFPMSSALEQAYQDSVPLALRPVDKTYDGYFACAMQQGLRAEFACTVGLHREDPRFAAAEHDFYRHVDPQNASRDKVVANKYLLDALWCDRMEQEEGEGSG